MEIEWKTISGMEWKWKCKSQALEWNGNRMEKYSLNVNGNVTVGFHSIPVSVKIQVNAFLTATKTDGF